MATTKHPGDIHGFTLSLPVAFMGFLCGMFTTIWTGFHASPTVGPTSAGAFAILAGIAALGLPFVREWGER